MKNFLKNLLYVAIILLAVYQFRGTFGLKNIPSFNQLKSQIATKYFPCEAPIPYKLATFSSEFNLSKEDFLIALAEAEAVWEEPMGKDLFVYEPENDSSNVLAVNLIYDYREQASKTLAAIGIEVKNTRASYDALKVKLAEVKKDYAKEKIAFDKSLADFNAKKDEYNEKVDYWNKKGGAPEEEYNKLVLMSEELERQSKELERKEIALNKTIDEVNSLIVAINGIAKTLNLSVEKYNTVSTARGESFEEGLYRSDGVTREIDVFEFGTKDKLLRVLAHEFGHALGIDHVEDPKAIMYKLNEGTNTEINATDLEALNAICMRK